MERELEEKLRKSRYPVDRKVDERPVTAALSSLFLFLLLSLAAELVLERRKI